MRAQAEAARWDSIQKGIKGSIEGGVEGYYKGKRHKLAEEQNARKAAADADAAKMRGYDLKEKGFIHNTEEGGNSLYEKKTLSDIKNTQEERSRAGERFQTDQQLAQSQLDANEENILASKASRLKGDKDEKALEVQRAQAILQQAIGMDDADPNKATMMEAAEGLLAKAGRSKAEFQSEVLAAKGAKTRAGAMSSMTERADPAARDVMERTTHVGTKIAALNNAINAIASYKGSNAVFNPDRTSTAFRTVVGEMEKANKLQADMVRTSSPVANLGYTGPMEEGVRASIKDLRDNLMTDRNSMINSNAPKPATIASIDAQLSRLDALERSLESGGQSESGQQQVALPPRNNGGQKPMQPGGPSMRSRQYTPPQGQPNIGSQPPNWSGMDTSQYGNTP